MNKNNQSQEAFQIGNGGAIAAIEFMKNSFEADLVVVGEEAQMAIAAGAASLQAALNEATCMTQAGLSTENQMEDQAWGNICAGGSEALGMVTQLSGFATRQPQMKINEAQNKLDQMTHFLNDTREKIVTPGPGNVDSPDPDNGAVRPPLTDEEQDIEIRIQDLQHGGIAHPLDPASAEGKKTFYNDGNDGEDGKPNIDKLALEQASAAQLADIEKSTMQEIRVVKEELSALNGQKTSAFQTFQMMFNAGSQLSSGFWNMKASSPAAAASAYNGQGQQEQAIAGANQQISGSAGSALQGARQDLDRKAQLVEQLEGAMLASARA